MRRSRINPVVKRAIKLALAVFICCVVGHGVFLPLRYASPPFKYAKEACSALGWAGITCVVVNSPVLGKVAQVSIERTIGTVLGGSLGFVTYWSGRHLLRARHPGLEGYYLSLMTALYAYIAVVVGNRLKLDVSARLTMITFLLVTFGAAAAGQGSLKLAITRTSGILVGVLVSLLVNVLVLPKSATYDILWDMRNALDGLHALGNICWHSFNSWKAQELERLSVASSAVQEQKSGLKQMLEAPAEPRIAVRQMELYEEEAELRLTAVINLLNKICEGFKDSANEVLLGVWCGRWCFLPAPSCYGSRQNWFKFKDDFMDLAVRLRKVSRLLWIVHLEFKEGFDVNMREYIQVQYPSELVSGLMTSCLGALQDLKNVYPNGLVTPSNNLHRFLQNVQGLISISDYYRRRIMKHMSHFKYMCTRRTSKPLLEMVGKENLPEPTRGILTPMAPPEQHSAFSERHVSFQQAGLPEQRRSADEAATGVLSRSPFRQQLSGAAEAGPLHSVLHILPDFPEFSDPPSPDTAAILASKPPKIPGRSRSMGNLTLNYMPYDDYVGSPTEAFDNMTTIKIDFASNRNSLDEQGYHQQKPAADVCTNYTEVAEQLHMKLRRLGSDELRLFPETAEGHLSQVRWYSFQFVMEELAEELGDAFNCMDRLLAKLRAVDGRDGFVRL